MPPYKYFRNKRNNMKTPTGAAFGTRLRWGFVYVDSVPGNMAANRSSCFREEMPSLL